MERFDLEYDLVIAGGGAGGMAAAVAARDAGLSVLLVEKEARLGGATALSGGTIWLAANPVLAAAGVDDTAERTRLYLKQVVQPPPDAVDAARIEAYVGNSPLLTALLKRHGVPLRHSRDWPDYYAQLPGGQKAGRTLHAAAFDLRALGDRADWMVSGSLFAAAHSVEVAKLALGARTRESIGTALRVFARGAFARLRGARLCTRGRALIGWLLRAAIALDVEIWRSAAMRHLIIGDGAVMGAVIARDGGDVRVRARRGVLLACGGYARNAALRAAHQAPVGTDATMAPAGDTGDALAIGAEAGAATAFLEEAWWVPGTKTPSGAMLHVWDRCFPHSLIVDTRGERYMDEAGPYMEVGQRMIRRHRELGVDHSWLILESRHRRRYAFGMAPPMITPREWFESGYMLRADSVAELAGKIAVEPERLRATLDRFNMRANAGDDQDFGRGSLPISRFYGDRRAGPNPNLGSVDRPPFYAVRVYPGDVGTAGGLRTDARARVLDRDLKPIAGLYAAGNAASPTFGAWYPGAGASIGPALMAGMLAARDAAENARGAR